MHVICLHVHVVCLIMHFVHVALIHIHVFVGHVYSCIHVHIMCTCVAENSKAHCILYIQDRQAKKHVHVYLAMEYNMYTYAVHTFSILYLLEVVQDR